MSNVETKPDHASECTCAALTIDEWNALEYVRVFMKELHCERQLPADLVRVASLGLSALDKLLDGVAP